MDNFWIVPLLHTTKIFSGNSLMSTSMVLVWMHYRRSKMNEKITVRFFFGTSWKWKAFQRFMNKNAPRLSETMGTHSISTCYRHSNKTRSTYTFGYEGKALVTCIHGYGFTSVPARVLRNLEITLQVNRFTLCWTLAYRTLYQNALQCISWTEGFHSIYT
jgi:hypothetical protein